MKMMINFAGEMNRLQKQISGVALQQLPFATAQTLSELAAQIKDAEKAALHTEFDRPTPFTVNSVGSTKATKKKLWAVVYVKDIAAAYLDPYEFGGLNMLNSKVLLKPVDQKLNQYGNIPRNTIAKLKARSDIFVGPVKTKSGEVIEGVWQREASSAKVTKTKKDKSISVSLTRRGLNRSGHLKLLIRFSAAHVATQHWHYRDRAYRIAKSNFNAVMGRNLAVAIQRAK